MAVLGFADLAASTSFLANLIRKAQARSGLSCEIPSADYIFCSKDLGRFILDCEQFSDNTPLLITAYKVTPEQYHATVADLKSYIRILQESEIAIAKQEWHAQVQKSAALLQEKIRTTMKEQEEKHERKVAFTKRTSYQEGYERGSLEDHTEQYDKGYSKGLMEGVQKGKNEGHAEAEDAYKTKLSVVENTYKANLSAVRSRAYEQEYTAGYEAGQYDERRLWSLIAGASLIVTNACSIALTCLIRKGGTRRAKREASDSHLQKQLQSLLVDQKLLQEIQIAG
jgi:hypothetical protein